MQLTQHFALEEFVHSELALRRGLDNTPYAGAIDNLKRLCQTVLEPVRELLGVEVRVTSGFRSAAVNWAVGGAIDSAHLDGRAADIVPLGIGLQAAFERIRTAGLPIDQLIREFPPGGWIHCGIADKQGKPRGQILLARSINNRTQYLPYTEQAT